jgi:hypothetical protein
MGSNFISDDATIFTSNLCIHDSNVAYSADFSINGEVDGWTYFDGIHTYGAWQGFLFGTMYGSYGIIGRHDIFRPVNATTHYILKIVMKYNPKTRVGIHQLPTQGKVRWRTLADTDWNSEKEKLFDIEADNKWHTYSLHMGVEQYWQGDVNDLRIWPAVDDARDGDEFFIRTIEVSSVELHNCTNPNCDKFFGYSHPCPWSGQRGYCESAAHEDNKLFTITENTELIININEYGNEIVKIKEVLNGSGYEVANSLAKRISAVGIGGYAEVQVVYTDENKFKIYSGTFADDSIIEVIDNDLTRYLYFFNKEGTETTYKTTGVFPSTGFSPFSSFKIRTSQILSLFDNNEETNIHFNPFGFSVEGGRRDWMSSGVGQALTSPGEEEDSAGGQLLRTYHLLYNDGRTIIDFNHPFNASGRINKIYSACTLDMFFGKTSHEGGDETGRIYNELSGAKIMIFRPRRDGTLDAIYEFDLNDRDADRGYSDSLYSLTQEVIDIDVDVFVNKGDLLGIYNANLYVGKSISGHEIDAQYFQIDGKPITNFNPGGLNGDGAGGVLLYAHGNDTQRRLVFDVDLKHRYNIENVEVKGLPKTTLLEYNIARCLDIDWEVDLFGEYHWTYHQRWLIPGSWYYQRYNVAYGLNRLNDGMLNVPDGLACDSYSITSDLLGEGYNYNTGPGIVPSNPYYFWINGDEEWLGIWLHTNSDQWNHAVFDFEYDPVAIFLHFPYQKEKTIYKSVIYFKEKFNFRSFSLSTYRGYYDNLGDADDPHYDLIPKYNSISLDNIKYEYGSALYGQVDQYLFKNPTVGHSIFVATSQVTYEWDPVLSDVIRDFSGAAGGPETGYFVHQKGIIANYEEHEQAKRIDWQTLQHEWDPITCKGFRIYCPYHKSTKICEIELYGVAQDVGSAFAGGVTVNYSDYNDMWWPSEPVQLNDTLVEAYIGDTPRYLSIHFLPIVETRYDDIVLNVKTEDFFAGKKGCEYSYYLEHSKLDGDNESQIIELKNVYEDDYDLFVDIAPDTFTESGLIFYSKLNDDESITNPLIGPDASYYKLPDYEIRNDDYNCAINCNVHGLKNLINGRTAYYSHDGMVSWQEFGQLQHNDTVNFHNLLTTAKTFISLPVLSRNRYWKFGFKCIDVSMDVRELSSYDENGVQYIDKQMYHDLDKEYGEGYVEYRAPHLENDSVIGSYYTLAHDQYITIDLGDTNKILKDIQLISDGISDYTLHTPDEDIVAGIDKYTKLCLHPWVESTGGYLRDVSYYENPVSLVGYSEIVDGSETSAVNLNVDFGCDDWDGWETIGSYYGSTFSGTCASGTVVSGTYEYPGYFDFDLFCSNWSIDRLHYNIQSDSVTKQVWQDVPFELNFKITISGVSGYGATHNEQGSMCVGLSNLKQSNKPYGCNCNLEFVVGPQIVFDPVPNRFGLAVRKYQPLNISWYDDVDVNAKYRDYTYTTGFQLNTEYYCRLYSLGSDNHYENKNITYRVEIWTDGWEGNDRVANLTLNSKQYWSAREISVSSCALGAGDNYHGDCSGWNNCDPEQPTYIKGRVSDLNLAIDYDSNNYPWKDSEVEANEKASIRIPDGESNYVFVPNSKDLDFYNKRYTIDFWVKFNTMPAVGEYYTLIENWQNPLYAWSLRLYNTGSWYRLEWWVGDGGSTHFVEYNGSNFLGSYTSHCYFLPKRWYYLLFSTGKAQSPQGYSRYSFFDINGRSDYDNEDQDAGINKYNIPIGGDISIGKKFDGWMSEIRISVGNNDTVDTSYGYGGSRVNTIEAFHNIDWLPVPSKPYEKLYTFSIYTSDNNEWFSHYADVDTMFDNSYSYFFDDSIFASKYNSYFVIDLDKRRCLDIIRHYGVSSLYKFTTNQNMIFSNIDTDDPNEAFQTEFTYDTDDSFLGWDNELPDSNKWIVSGIDDYPLDYIGIRNGYLESKADSSHTTQSLKTKYSIQGEFDIEVKWGRTASSPDEIGWCSVFRADFSNGSNGPTYISMQAEYDSTNPSPYYYMRVIFSDNNIIDEYTVSLAGINDSGMRIIRQKEHFYCQYFDVIWKELTDRPIWNAVGKDVLYVTMGTTTKSNNPTVINYYKDFKVNSADKLLVRSDHTDARWASVELLNGDNVDRYIEKIGIYPDITENIVPGGDGYNCEWVYLGPSITNFTTSTNVALGVTASGSSYVGTYTPDKTVDGVIGSDFSEVWGTDSASTQWLLLDLGSEKQIYRVKLYHGYSEDDSDYLITNYQIQISTDNQSFSTIFNIIDNTSFERTHDLIIPVTVRYLRLYITGYDTVWRYITVGTTRERFEGAVLREIEVYEYYGYPLISSEEYPIITVDLRDQFYIDSHSIPTLVTGENIYDWNNADSNFAYSDSVFDEPKKVTFTAFGEQPNYEQWVVLKRNTASYYNASPSVDPPDDVGIDYLKGLTITTIKKSNPVNCWWWWQSDISVLSNDYDKSVEFCTNSLQIDYPASSALDHVCLREGTTFGIDSKIARRDGLTFRLYIEDINKLDTSDGYFYFGGLDGTDTHSPVEYRWNFSTLSGTNALQTGWNRPYFRFRTADEVIYDETYDLRDAIHPLMREYMTMKTVGLKFKGVGQPLTLNLDGFLIRRNHFNDYSKFSQGLYLNSSEYLTTPLNEIDFTSGTIEFWFRPDYTFAGQDEFRRFKNRALFNFGNVVNDVFGMMFTSNGVVFYFGNMSTNFSALLIKGLTAEPIDKLFHFGIVFSSNGRNISGDNSTIRFYINNYMVGINYEPWEIIDNKLFKFTFGGKGPLGLIEQASSLTTSSVDGVVSDLRIYNYCKTDFTDSMSNIPDETRISGLVNPSEMIEISDNVTYYKVGDPELPLFFEKVSPGTTIPIYVRSIVPKGLTGKEKRTGGIVASWDVGI